MKPFALSRKLSAPLIKSLLLLTIFTVALATLVSLTTFDAFAQSVTLDMGPSPGASTTGRIIQLVLLMTVLTLAPSILIMMTSFTRIVVVLSFLRNALGTQQTPPNQVLISLALFMTLFIMMPTFQTTYDEALQPLIDGSIDETQAFNRALVPFETFMMKHVREQDLGLFVDLAGLKAEQVAQNMPMRVLIPAFMISELRRAFEIGFLVFVPFLIIDMVVASVLMSMGMMMLPPVMIALPFKIIFFVLVDGWYMIVGSLVRSYGA
ncbi:flagellar type III secretion system pore protein FliP [Magnetovibrio blakemorei]|uniref:Flagellar biosynthetic protein FliP n=1 Tax=Magnetovibrio blakemorei TaxID=28181 RepID=A0A1E5QA96_9PROT|nr:flagellar type III secretion system pore protein FliP [Magnetovibrio blakemorei]OEJ68709.1 flagellar biosynthetic protein FliP [Magnetovibrio blakemorei]